MGVCQSQSKRPQDNASEQPTAKSPQQNESKTMPSNTNLVSSTSPSKQIPIDEIDSYVSEIVSQIFLIGLLEVDPTPITKSCSSQQITSNLKELPIIASVTQNNTDSAPTPAQLTPVHTANRSPNPELLLSPFSPSVLIKSDYDYDGVNFALPKSHLDESDPLSTTATLHERDETSDETVPITFHILKTPISNVVSTNKTAHNYISTFSSSYADKMVIFIAHLSMTREGILHFNRSQPPTLLSSECSYSNDLCIIDIDLTLQPQQISTSQSQATPQEELKQIETNLELLRTTLEKAFRFVIISIKPASLKDTPSTSSTDSSTESEHFLTIFGNQFINNLALYAPMSTTSANRKTVSHHITPCLSTPQKFDDLLSIYRNVFYYTLHQQTPPSNPSRFINDIAKYQSFITPFVSTD